MSETIALLYKEFKIEFRQKHTLVGILLFVLSSSFICYLSFEEIKVAAVWSGLLWLIGLFSAFHAMAKTFITEGQGAQLYLYSLANPKSVILSKSLYNAILVAFLNLVSCLLFTLFFGSSALADADILQFSIGLILGSSGLGIALTLISGIAYKASQNLGLMAILGFPVIVPLLLALVNFSTVALQGLSWEANLFNLVVLIVINISSLVLAVILFPYLWRD